MHGHPETLMYKLRFIIAGIFVIASLFSLTLLLSAIAGSQNTGESRDIIPSNSQGSPNAVTSGLAAAVNGSGHFAAATDRTISTSLKSVSSGLKIAVSKTASTAIIGTEIAVHAVQVGVYYYAYSISTSIGFMARSVAATSGYLSNAAVVNAVVQPAYHDSAPVIDPYAPINFAVQKALPTASAASSAGNHSTSNAADWPIHGDITTYFGVPHWPYQPTHTGIDISDGKRSGITEIKPFRPGTVTEAVRSPYGLGNHIIIDHGNGLTSVYGHLYTISVQPGQVVDSSTILGLEGSTGASTGTHLHFEIRINGQPVNPLQYINGQP